MDQHDPLLIDPERTVCFTGHRHLPQPHHELTRSLALALEKLYQLGYRQYLCGMALGFDQLAARAVIALRSLHEDVQLIAAIPCSTQSEHWTKAQAADYERLLYSCDRTVVLSPIYYEGCMQARNRYMVDHAGMCVAYMTAPRRSGTWSTIAYAVRRGVPVLNLAVASEVERFLAQP